MIIKAAEGLLFARSGSQRNNEVTRAMIFFWVRLGMYIVVTLAAFQGLIVAVVSSPMPGAFFKDGGPWEWVEFSFAAASGAILLLNAHVSGKCRTVLQVFGLLALFAAVRELDHLLDQLVFDGAYKLINGSILALCGYLGNASTAHRNPGRT